MILFILTPSQFACLRQWSLRDRQFLDLCVSVLMCNISRIDSPSRHEGELLVIIQSKYFNTRQAQHMAMTEHVSTKGGALRPNHGPNARLSLLPTSSLVLLRLQPRIHSPETCIPNAAYAGIRSRQTTPAVHLPPSVYRVAMSSVTHALPIYEPVRPNVRIPYTEGHSLSFGFPARIIVTKAFAPPYSNTDACTPSARDSLNRLTAEETTESDARSHLLEQLQTQIATQTARLQAIHRKDINRTKELREEVSRLFQLREEVEEVMATVETTRTEIHKVKADEHLPSEWEYARTGP
ncbi:hypothetical protein PLICRDRAFT_26319 [Plicaturopsis crispa FD-325 SS-3]|nr:hypothetical protein PLICRDRAFT_26319 [Plicaturopsis crispa FD-325 SS-3]